MADHLLALHWASLLKAFTRLGGPGDRALGLPGRKTSPLADASGTGGAGANHMHEIVLYIYIYEYIYIYIYPSIYI